MCSKSDFIITQLEVCDFRILEKGARDAQMLHIELQRRCSIFRQLYPPVLLQHPDRCVQEEAGRSQSSPGNLIF